MNGLIPEEVYTKQSMTLKYAKNFDTPFGRFEYTHISKSAFSVGLTSIKKASVCQESQGTRHLVKRLFCPVGGYDEV